MPFIQTPESLDNIPEESAAPEGPYDLTVVKVGESYVKEETGRTVLPLTIRIDDPEYPDAKLVGHWLTFPTEADREEEPNTYKLLMRGIKRFCSCFSVEWGDEGFETEDLDGATGNCMLTQEEYEGETNNKLRLPRMQE